MTGILLGASWLIIVLSCLVMVGEGRRDEV